jgi:hypothetical protein
MTELTYVKANDTKKQRTKGIKTGKFCGRG